MRVLLAAAVIALLAGPAYAQSQSVPKYGETNEKKSRSEIEAEKAADQAYKKSLGNIPNQGPVDPWGNVRSDSAPKTAAKTPAKTAAKATPAKPAKTDSTAK